MNEWKRESMGLGEDERIYLAPVLGRIAGADDAGVLVAFDGREPVRARLFAAGVELCELMRPESVGREVLISCEQGDPLRPIITALSNSMLDELVSVESSVVESERKPEARVDGKRVVFEADEEIVLKCGKGSITLNKCGKIVLRGTEVLSRASGSNRIKGGSVGIN